MNLKTFLLAALAITLICLAGLPAAAQVEPFRSLPALTGTTEVAPVITGIDVRGNFFLPKKDIMDVIFSRIGDSVVQEKIRGDLKAIYALGYFADVSTSFEASNGGTKVVFLVTENPQLENIIIQGNTVYSTVEILGWLSLKKGELLNFNKLQADIATINAHYKDDGYMLARVIDVDTDEQARRLTFKIVEGVVESIALEGNDSTQDYVILRELKTKPGSVLNENTLKKDLRRVFNLGFFSSVTPNFEAGSSPDRIIILLKIEETRTSTINFGGGYGEREGWFGFVDLSINNLFGTGQGLLIRGQSGQELSTYQFRYNNPWLLPDRLGDHANFTFKRWLTIGRDYFLSDQDGIYNGFELSLGKPLNDYYNITWSLGSELVTPHNNATFEGYQSDTVGVTLSYDTRDFWLNPTEGRYYSLSFKQGWKHVSHATSGFFKIGSDLNHYYPIFDNQVLAMHIGAGIGFDDVPIGEEYWAGGPNSVRGYYYGDAKRGKRKLIFNTEYRLNFSDLFQGVFFYDWGDAWNEGPPDFADFISGWGPGIRVNTPLGPIRLDYGVPGGKAFSEGIMHFSIGQAF
ncbi:MAG: BamA/TamA family outer membrane protein [Candidatus Saganbacteria bacterium]|nr:BamA/TamA family outer membrane protein [Candidatus Saganbacteria bacterium]